MKHYLVICSTTPMCHALMAEYAARYHGRMNLSTSQVVCDDSQYIFLTLNYLIDHFETLRGLEIEEVITERFITIPQSVKVFLQDLLKRNETYHMV